MLIGLACEVVQQNPDFGITSLLGQWHEHTRAAQVAVILRNLIFEDQVIAEQVVRDF